MPQLIPLYNSNSYQQLLIDIYNSIILKDIIQHNDIKNSNLMGLLINFMIDNTSKITSPNKIMESFLKDNRNTNIETLYKYIDSIVSSCLLEKVKRYDVKGKNILSTLEKFYLADVCFRNLIPNSDNQLGRKLENIIYNELKFFSSSINVGKFDTKEIDFVVVSNTMNKYYIQVAYELNTSETIEREFSPLRKLTDGCKRFVISMNSGYSEEGINNISVKEFLLNIEDYIK
ncbi:hypothetical protein FACS189459_4980 [Bacilli bacterium]|nr:hypothetical protein FACS189459_4980 [Bacilli bacterium]